MTSPTEEYARTSQELLTKAQEALTQDDLLQASEKGWGAAAQMVKAVAQRRGWRHNGHRELYLVVNQLAQATSDNDFRLLFAAASALHSNFYENWMPREMVEAYLAQVRQFVQKLEALS